MPNYALLDTLSDRWSEGQRRYTNKKLLFHTATLGTLTRAIPALRCCPLTTAFEEESLLVDSLHQTRTSLSRRSILSSLMLQYLLELANLISNHRKQNMND